MKFKFCSLFIIAVFVGFSSCNSDGKKEKSQADTLSKVDTLAEIDVMVVSEKILKAIKEKDFATFVNYIHPTEGVRFSASSAIDVKNDKVLTKAQVLELSKTKKKFTWGIHESIGEPIVMNLDKYIDEFVYDVDFIKVAKKQKDTITNNNPNSASNIKKIYPQSEFVEFFYAGDGKKFDGLDWKALTLIFKIENNSAYLIGISHRQWES
jgi:hypothetical protein